MFKKIGSLFSIIFLIPILTYGLLILGAYLVTIIYLKTNHLMKVDISQNMLTLIINKTEYYGAILGDIITIILLFLFFRISKQKLKNRCKFKKINFGKLLTILPSIIAIAIFSIIFVHLQQGNIGSYREIEKSMNENIITIIGAIMLIVIIPILEEIIFRGIILGSLIKHINIIVAIIIQAIIFSLMHGNIIQYSYTFPLGIVLGIAFLYGESIFTDIICHMVFNLFGLLIIPIITIFYYNTLVFSVIGILFFILTIITYLKRNKIIKYFS